MKKLNFAIILCIAFAAVISCEQRNDYAYEDWDTDNDGVINNSEFDTRWNEMGYYDTWDRNADGRINEEEWNSGVSDNYPNFDPNASGNNYSGWDRDGDGLLDKREFGEGNYSLWDSNNDGNIQDTEYKEWYRDI